MTWDDLNAALLNYLEAGPVGSAMPANLAAAIPVIVNNAEMRIYRDLDFLAFRGQNTSLTVTDGSRVFSLTPMAGQQIDGTGVAYGWPVVVEGIALVLPAGADATTGTAIPLEPAGLDFIDFIWPKQNVTQRPVLGSAYYAMLDDQTAIICPTPDAPFQAVVTGVWRPEPMSSTNTETWLGTYASDIFFDASMIEAEGFIRNFGAQGDDPRTAMSWEQSYKTHWIALVNEERRRKGLSPLPVNAVPPSMSDQAR